MTAAMACTTLAAAEERPPADGFGKRSATVVTVENVFGFQEQDLSDEDLDTLGFFPPLSRQIGVYGVERTGFSYGAALGFDHSEIDTDGGLLDGLSFTVLRLRPRLGYAASKADPIGFWFRAGPSLLLVLDDDGDASYALAASLEAYVVALPVSHAGFFFGPQLDLHLTGADRDGNDFEYKSTGLMVGFLGEIW